MTAELATTWEEAGVVPALIDEEILTPRDLNFKARAYQIYEKLSTIRPYIASSMGEVLCSPADGDLFFPDQSGGSQFVYMQCSLCPSKNACLLQAFRNGETFGIWGGLNFSQRVRITEMTNNSAEEIQERIEQVSSKVRDRALRQYSSVPGLKIV